MELGKDLAQQLNFTSLSPSFYAKSIKVGQMDLCKVWNERGGKKKGKKASRRVC